MECIEKADECGTIPSVYGPRDLVVSAWRKCRFRTRRKRELVSSSGSDTSFVWSRYLCCGTTYDITQETSPPNSSRYRARQESIRDTFSNASSRYSSPGGKSRVSRQKYFFRTKKSRQKTVLTAFRCSPPCGGKAEATCILDAI